MLGSVLSFLEDIIPEGIPGIDSKPPYTRPEGLAELKTDKSKSKYPKVPGLTPVKNIKDFNQSVSTAVTEDHQQIYLANIMLRQHIEKCEQMLYDIMITGEYDEEALRLLIHQDKPIQFELF